MLSVLPAPTAEASLYRVSRYSYRAPSDGAFAAEAPPAAHGVCPCPTNAPVCCECDHESGECIGGCCDKASNCCPGGRPGSGTCTNVLSDPDNCGHCGNACPAGQRCSGGACVTTCPPGKTLCGHTCVDTTRDITNCGQCGNICGTSFPGCCGGQCVNLSDNNSNCGVCGNACPPGRLCAGLQCVCEGTGRLCQGGQCQNGACVCPTGLTYCAASDQCQNPTVPGLIQDGCLLDGDVLIFYPVDLTGAVIDAFSGGYGYSHTGLACPSLGNVMIDVDDTTQATPEVEQVPLATALQRGHVGVRFGLTETEAKMVCACAQSQLGMPEFSTAGVDLCTTLILNCMSNAGFDINALGLGGSVVSPNRISRTFGAPPGVQFISGFG